MGPPIKGRSRTRGASVGATILGAAAALSTNACATGEDNAAPPIDYEAGVDAGARDGGIDAPLSLLLPDGSVRPRDASIAFDAVSDGGTTLVDLDAAADARRDVHVGSGSGSGTRDAGTGTHHSGDADVS